MTWTRDPALLIRPELKALSAYYLELEPSDHKLDQNEVPYDLPRRLKVEAFERLLAADWSRYPDFHSDDLRRDLGRLHRWPYEGVLVGNGSNELLDLLITSLVGPGGELLGSDPSFPVYRMVVQKTAAVAHFLPPRADLQLPIAELQAEVERNPRRPLLLCSPNNPTGDAVTVGQVERLLETLEAPLLLDNAYAEFCRHDYRPLLDRHPHLILFRTFSKAWSLAGLRLGYLLAAPSLVSELVKVKLPYNVGRASAVAGQVVLAAEPAARRRVGVILGRREQLAAILAEAGLEVFPSEANFLLVRCRSRAAAKRLREGLAERGIRVRDVGVYPGLDGCLRVSVGNGPAMRALRRALAEMAAELGEEAGEAERAAPRAPVQVG